MYGSNNIYKIKSIFFLNRALTYASFLLIPTWVPKFITLTVPFQIILILFYILFIIGQWFLLGKEIDHRFKIYYKVNSSIDRTVYRILSGKVLMTLYFGLLGTLPLDIVKHFFWGTWVVLGLFYSWPTRGKIIEETISGQLLEFKFLDAFEKTVIFLILIFIIISIPQLPIFENIEAIKLYLDPSENFNPLFWNFINVNYYPLLKFPQLYKLSWWLHFYLIEGGLFLLTFYIFLRLFISRRLSILGIFSLVSSWSFSKILNFYPGAIFESTFSILWIWSTLWCVGSATYRSGLFLGLIGLWGCIVNIYYFLLIPIQLLLLYPLFFKKKTFWYKRQVFKYSLFGIIISILLVVFNFDYTKFVSSSHGIYFIREISSLLEQKAFFIISIFGIFLLPLLFFREKIAKLKQWGINQEGIASFSLMLALLLICSVTINDIYFKQFSTMWVIVFLALLPLEWILQTIRRMRSQTNIIYMIYVIICLLDSHFEGRIKIIINFFKS